MRAALLNSYTTTEIGDAVVVGEVDSPTIENADDLIVRVVGAGVCRTDLHILEGQNFGERPVPLPHVLGHENAGVVEAVGAGVVNFAVGDLVLCYPFLTTGLDHAERQGFEHHVVDRSTPGINAPGGYAEFLKIRERAAVALPKGSDPIEYAPLADAGLAAFRACRKAAEVLRSSDTAYIVGVGGLGHLGLQILKILSPAKVVAIDVRQAARDLAHRLGADAVYASFAEAASASINPPKAVIDFVGSEETLTSAIDGIQTGGRLELVGVEGRLDIPARLLVERELTVSGSLVGTFAELLELTELVAEGRLEVVTTKYPLDQVAAALTDLREGRVLGRAVLVP